MEQTTAEAEQPAKQHEQGEGRVGEAACPQLGLRDSAVSMEAAQLAIPREMIDMLLQAHLRHHAYHAVVSEEAVVCVGEGDAVFVLRKVLAELAGADHLHKARHGGSSELLLKRFCRILDDDA